jgi:hypothetical protein
VLRLFAFFFAFTLLFGSTIRSTWAQDLDLHGTWLLDGKELSTVPTETLSGDSADGQPPGRTTVSGIGCVQRCEPRPVRFNCSAIRFFSTGLQNRRTNASKRVRLRGAAFGWARRMGNLLDLGNAIDVCDIEFSKRHAVVLRNFCCELRFGTRPQRFFRSQFPNV